MAWNLFPWLWWSCFLFLLLTDFRKPWASLDHSREQYFLKYEGKYLQELGNSLDKLYNMVVQQAITETLKYTALSSKSLSVQQFIYFNRGWRHPLCSSFHPYYGWLRPYCGLLRPHYDWLHLLYIYTPTLSCVWLSWECRHNSWNPKNQYLDKPESLHLLWVVFSWTHYGIKPVPVREMTTPNQIERFRFFRVLVFPILAFSRSWT